MRKQRGPMAVWSHTDLLLRRIDLRLAGANWQRSGGKGLRPKPIELPEHTKKKPAVASGDDVAQRLRNLGLVPTGDVRNPPPATAAGGDTSAQEMAAIAEAWWQERQQKQ